MVLPRRMKLLFVAGGSLLLFFIIIHSSASVSVESDIGVTPNKTDAFGVVIDSNTSSIEQHGAAIVGNELEEKRRSLAIFFILFVLVLAILIVHILIISKVHFIPESLAIVILGGLYISFLLSEKH
ncbi:hypothetical protein OESDEN_00409 [Oesophagostomum dentatum]|uniref:Uncharacterized protein n=1 Tax=Oesophagostomum dentatum TaxID=61180 RepID=A0A0B1TVX3_OESDE|nr:hypothetical protein OESDEN_00409 [Oesophagostomum dentatum]